MPQIFDTDVPLSGSVLDAQNNDVKTAEQVLQAMQEDLADDSKWARENIDATIELLKQWRRQ